MSNIRLISTFLLALSLTACGQKRALYLPKENQSNIPAMTDNVNNPTDFNKVQSPTTINPIVNPNVENPNVKNTTLQETKNAY